MGVGRLPVIGAPTTVVTWPLAVPGMGAAVCITDMIDICVDVGGDVERPGMKVWGRVGEAVSPLCRFGDMRMIDSSKVQLVGVGGSFGVKRV